MYNSTIILQNAEFIKNDKFSMDFTICKMSSEFIILHFAESIARSRGHVSGPVSARVRTPDLLLHNLAACFFQTDFSEKKKGVNYN